MCVDVGVELGYRFDISVYKYSGEYPFLCVLDPARPSDSGLVNCRHVCLVIFTCTPSAACVNSIPGTWHYWGGSALNC